jgi:hypothetical protein
MFRMFFYQLAVANHCGFRCHTNATSWSGGARYPVPLPYLRAL